jgi:CheY-like chemotaxis protein
VESEQIQRKVLMIGANPLVRNTVRVLLRSMGYQCLTASSLKEALSLLEQQKPDAAILDPQLPDSTPARVVAAFHKRVPDLRGRSLVLVGEEADPDLLQVLDAYSIPRVQQEALFRELWPSLDSLLLRVVSPPQVTRAAPLVFDSVTQLSLAGARSALPLSRQLRYESGSLVADLLLEEQRDSQRITMTGQVFDTAKRELQLRDVPIVIQGQRGFIGMVKTNEWGEFQFEFEVEPDITLEIGTRKNFWVSVGLPHLNGVTGLNRTTNA